MKLRVKNLELEAESFEIEIPDGTPKGRWYSLVEEHIGDVVDFEVEEVEELKQLEVGKYYVDDNFEDLYMYRVDSVYSDDSEQGYEVSRYFTGEPVTTAIQSCYYLPQDAVQSDRHATKQEIVVFTVAEQLGKQVKECLASREEK